MFSAGYSEEIINSVAIAGIRRNGVRDVGGKPSARRSQKGRRAESNLITGDTLISGAHTKTGKYYLVTRSEEANVYLETHAGFV